jgi:hypothetical protein
MVITIHLTLSAASLVPQFEVVAAYDTNVKEFSSALGIYFTAWFIISVVS